MVFLHFYTELVRILKHTLFSLFCYRCERKNNRSRLSCVWTHARLLVGVSLDKLFFLLLSSYNNAEYK